LAPPFHQETRRLAPLAAQLSYAVIAFTLVSPAVILAIVLPPYPWSAVAGSVGVVALGFAVARAFRIAIAFDTTGITVENYWRTHRVPWNDVIEVGTGIEIVDTMAIKAIAIRARGRSIITVQATTSSNRKRERFAQDLTARLQSYRESPWSEVESHP